VPKFLLVHDDGSRFFVLLPAWSFRNFYFNIDEDKEKKKENQKKKKNEAERKKKEEAERKKKEEAERKKKEEAERKKKEEEEKKKKKCDCTSDASTGCKQTDNGPECICKSGFKLNSDGKCEGKLVPLVSRLL